MKLGHTPETGRELRKLMDRVAKIETLRDKIYNEVQSGVTPERRATLVKRSKVLLGFQRQLKMDSGLVP